MRWIALIACGWMSAASPQPADPPANPPEPPADPAPSVLTIASGIVYEHAGDPARPAIVFIHGGYGDRRMWNAQFDAFAGEYHVIRYDHRGFGGSKFPVARYEPDADLVAILDALGVTRAHLVGNSMGGMLALDVALTHPDRVASLTLVSSGPAGLAVPEPEREAVRAVFSAATSQGPAAAVDLWLAQPTVALSSKDPVVGPRVREMVAQNSKMFAIKHWPTMRLDPPASRRLAELTLPTLVIVGEHDTAYVRGAASTAADGIAGARLVTIPGADHLPHMITPDAFNAELRAFVSTQAAEPAPK